MYSFLVIRNVYTFLVKKLFNPLCPPVKTRFFVFTKFSMPNGSHMDAHRIFDQTVVHLFKCILKLGPCADNMLQAVLSPRLVG